LGAAKDNFVYDGTVPRYLTLGANIGWSKTKIADFDVKVSRGRSDITFTLKSSTSFPLGAIKQFYTKKAKSSTVVLEAMNFLNQLFASHPSTILLAVGRKFFNPNERNIVKSDLIEFRKGLFQAVHFGGRLSLTINVDVTTGVFWNSDYVTALELSCRALNCSAHDLAYNRLSPQQLHRLSRLLKGLKFQVKHRGEDFAKRQHSISKVAHQSAKTYMFEMNDDTSKGGNAKPRTISVNDYMRVTYNLRLKYPDAVLVMKGPSTYFPLELCYLVPVSICI
jgi:hypothetical protein